MPSSDLMDFGARSVLPEFHVFAWASQNEPGPNPSAEDVSIAPPRDSIVNFVLTNKDGKPVSSQQVKSDILQVRFIVLFRQRDNIF